VVVGFKGKYLKEDNVTALASLPRIKTIKLFPGIICAEG
jgi:hypothetical protein